MNLLLVSFPLPQDFQMTSITVSLAGTPSPQRHKSQVRPRHVFRNTRGNETQDTHELVESRNYFSLLLGLKGKLPGQEAVENVLLYRLTVNERGQQ